MAQRNDIVEKHKLFFDGEEVPGLVSFGATPLEDGAVEVPEFGAINKIRDGIVRMPEIPVVFKLQRDSRTLKFCQDFYLNKETKDLVKVRTDASGTEFARTLFEGCECRHYEEPEFDAASPTYAKATIIILPHRITPIPPA